MACKLEDQLIKDTIAFHGHNCPGLTIGIRAAELAREKLDIHNASTPVCVTETDMCGVDAIQFLTGCSFGKGNLIHKDFGKSAFTFYNRDTQKGFRAVFNNDFGRDEDETLSLDDQRQLRIKRLLAADLTDLFSIQPIDTPPVRPARIMKSLACSNCGEKTMESRIRLFDGKTLCMPCFGKVEQKI
ncbi:MAG: TraR/DksA C4-type zinc finger protein [Proteobacteria bacterium]|nr:TraR/DksA C4-type zinc finger protein [Pseudomonadota bacterium]MBU1390018.1 TraR/DksA C4-type zinc finger protein [Pseudomonadota bacterium]MBU1545031.1 TraR/DksA C4-type zinc finger protein [Pseudomonadota bacterium]MBU2480365.1 TraR/DksA C4-type zinc finger protein [Pseudomonadota bacterium]